MLKRALLAAALAATACGSSASSSSTGSGASGGIVSSTSSAHGTSIGSSGSLRSSSGSSGRSQASTTSGTSSAAVTAASGSTAGASTSATSSTSATAGASSSSSGASTSAASTSSSSSSSGGIADAGSPDAGPGWPDGGCVAEQVVGCSCASGVGTQRCAADGRGFGACTCAGYGAEIVVSPSGDDTAAGTLAAPFRTLERAQTAVRALLTSGGAPDGGVVVWLRGGVYPRTAPFTLTSDDSGTPSAPVVYRGYPGETARLVGGVELDAGSAQPVTSASPVWSRLDPSAQGSVVAYDLGALGVTDFGTLQPRGFGVTGVPAALELFIDGQRAPLGRWPEAGETDPGAATPSTDAGEVIVYASGLVPDVTGTYVMDSVQDGASSFTRQGQVNGETWHLYRTTGGTPPSTWVAWFLTTNASGYPAATDPFFFTYQESLGPMQPAQGAQGIATFIDPTAANDGFASLGSASPPVTFTFTTDRAARWASAPDPWVHGFFAYTWADAHSSVAVLDGGELELSEAPFGGLSAHLVGGGASVAYAYNLLEEITQPGEWYLDRGSGLLYLWPPRPLAAHELVVSTLSGPLIAITGASQVTLQELTLEASRTQLLSVSGGASQIQVVGCTLRDSGDAAASVTASSGVLFDGDVIHDTGEDGVLLGGGDRPSLTAAANTVQNSHLHDFSQWVWTYTPAVNLSGDGNVVQHNLIHGAPHSAILFDSSSQHLIQYNDIHDVLQFTSDCGAIYAWADWGSYGNLIQDNYIHDIASQLVGYGVHAIYLDGCLSGAQVTSNVIVNVAGTGLFHNGGHDITMTNNIIVSSGTALLASSYCAFHPMATCMPGNTDFVAQLEALDYQQDPWASTYPSCARIPDDCALVTAPDSGWLTPYGTVFADNVSYDNATFTSADAPSTFADYAQMDDNLDGTDPLFVDPDAGDYALQPGSPAFGLPGFAAIPFSSIGIQH